MRSLLYTALLAAFAVLSTSASALPDSDFKARSPAPSAYRRAPAPSPAAKRYDPRAPAPSAARRSLRDQEPILSGGLSQQLCPQPLSVCPIAGSSAPLAHAFECVDFSADLNSCGGCGSTDVEYDCTAIPGAFGVSCVASGCHIDSCKEGFAFAHDRKACVAQP